MAKSDSPQTADVLEIYALCLLLGYRGRYSMSGQESVRSVASTVTEKLQHLRGGPRPLAPNWAPPKDVVQQKASDPWVRALLFGTLGALLFADSVFCGVQIRAHFRGIRITLDRSAYAPLGSPREHQIEILDCCDCSYRVVGPGLVYRILVAFAREQPLDTPDCTCPHWRSSIHHRDLVVPRQGQGTRGNDGRRRGRQAMKLTS